MRGRPVTVLAGAAVVLAAVAGCSSGAGPVSPGPASATARPAISRGAAVDPATFASGMARAGTVVLDVRTPAEFHSGHLPGAANIDVEAADFATRISALDKTASYAVYCRTGNRSATAVAVMTGRGFTDVYHLAGGIQAWAGAGRPIVTT